MRLGKYAIAIEAFRSVISKEPNNIFVWMNLAICYVLTDEVDKAQKAAAEVIRVHPVFCIDLYKKSYYVSEETERGRLEIGALRKAGIPEHPPSK